MAEWTLGNSKDGIKHQLQETERNLQKYSDESYDELSTKFEDRSRFHESKLEQTTLDVVELQRRIDLLEQKNTSNFYLIARLHQKLLIFKRVAIIAAIAIIIYNLAK